MNEHTLFSPVNTDSNHVILRHKRRESNKHWGHGMTLTSESKAKRLPRNYGNIANLANSLSVLDHSNSVLIVFQMYASRWLYSQNGFQ